MKKHARNVAEIKHGFVKLNEICFCFLQGVIIFNCNFNSAHFKSAPDI